MVIRVTYLAQPVGASDSTINIVSPAGFPVEQFQIAIFNTTNGQVEQMLVPQGANQTTFNTTTWTVTPRGINGTTAIAHSAGDMVVQVSGASFGQTVTYPSTNDPNNLTRMLNQQNQQNYQPYPPPDSTNQTAVYAPLYVYDSTNNVKWIVAFGWVTLTVTQSAPSQPMLTLTLGNPAGASGNYMAPANAMGVPSSLYGAVSLLTLNQNDANTLLASLFAAPTSQGIPYYILAPSLVRTEK